MSLRDEKQELFAKKWMDDGDKFGILLLAPRFGKIRTTINIFNKLQPKRILIAYPDLKIEASWKNDFEKFGFVHDDITFTTHLSLKKYVNEKYDMIVIDEIHLLSTNQLDSLETLIATNNEENVLGLTGTMTRETEAEIFDATGLDVVVRYPIEAAVRDGIVADYEIIVKTVPLDNTKPLNFKGKMRTEKKQFDAIGWVIEQKQLRGEETMFLRLSRMRIIQNSIAKLEYTRKLLEQMKHERVLVFCGVTKIADSLGIPSYHSKAGERKMFEDFANGEGNHMAVVKIGNTGR